MAHEHFALLFAEAPSIEGMPAKEHQAAELLMGVHLAEFANFFPKVFLPTRALATSGNRRPARPLRANSVIVVNRMSPKAVGLGCRQHNHRVNDRKATGQPPAELPEQEGRRK